MFNLDKLKEQKTAVMQKLSEAVKTDNSEAFCEAFTELAENIQQAVLAEAKGLISEKDEKILIGRGVRQLTSEETNYYQKVIQAMKSGNPQQELTMIDEIMPRTIIDAVFEDIQEDHPLLSEIDFVNTGVLTDYVFSLQDGRHRAVWGKLCDEVVAEMVGSFDSVSLTQKKLSAFLPICKAMLEIGPQWLDRYTRAVLAESLLNGLEYGIIDGDGLDEPTGMKRDPTSPLDPATGYGALAPIPLTSITPSSFGPLMASLASNRNGLSRPITEAIFIVNPVTYYLKVVPAVSYQNADGTWVQRWPFPTKVIQSAYVDVDEAILTIPKKYFMGLGSGKGGKIEYSDHYHFLEDDRVYLIKLYGNGCPKDAVSHIVLDLSNLAPVTLAVNATIMNDPLDTNITNDPLNVVPVIDARLASLKVGTLTLSPAFNKSIFYYETDTTNATNAIQAVAMDGEATIEILNGSTPVENGAAATWGEGENILTIELTSGSETETYTVIVTKS